MSLRSIPLVLFAVLASACGGIADSGDGGLGDGGGGGDSAPGPDCPSALPSEGAACGKTGLECEYGSDPRWACNTIALCNQGVWTREKASDTECPTPATNPPECPASWDVAKQGGACSSFGTSCNYSTSSETRFCSCGAMGGPIQIDGGGAIWYCGGPYDPQCPAARPRIGSPCSAPSTFCSYDVCGLPSGLSVQCDGETGTWTTSPGAVCAGAN